MNRRIVVLVLLGLALVNTAAVAAWAFSMGANPLVAMPPMAQLTAFLAVVLRLERLATVFVLGVAAAVTILLVVLAMLTIGMFLLPALALDIAAIVMVWLARDTSDQPAA